MLGSTFKEAERVLAATFTLRTLVIMAGNKLSNRTLSLLIIG